MSKEVRIEIYTRSLLIVYTEGPVENVSSFPTLNGHAHCKFPSRQELRRRKATWIYIRDGN